MHKASSLVSKLVTIIALCCTALAFGGLLISVYPAHANGPHAATPAKPSVDKHTSSKLSVKDWILLVKN